MQAALLEASGKPIEVRDIPTPEPGPGEALVRVAAVGACHSDLHIADGDLDAMLAMLPEPPPRPMVLGHEIAGTVEQLGPDAAGVAVGDRVGVHWIAPCGACPNCAVGAETACLTPMTQRSWPGGGGPWTGAGPSTRRCRRSTWCASPTR